MDINVSEIMATPKAMQQYNIQRNMMGVSTNLNLICEARSSVNSADYQFLLIFYRKCNSNQADTQGATINLNSDVHDDSNDHEKTRKREE